MRKDKGSEREVWGEKQHTFTSWFGLGIDLPDHGVCLLWNWAPNCGSWGIWMEEHNGPHLLLSLESPGCDGTLNQSLSLGPSYLMLFSKT